MSASTELPTAIRWQDSGFPPYGHVSRDYRLEIEQVAVPPRFRVRSSPGTSLQWQAYVQRESTAMADFLWPRFDRATGQWQGAAVATMRALTEADLVLMRELSTRLQAEATVPLEDAAVPASAAPKSKGLERSHLDLFYAEDRSARPTLATYLPALDATVLADIDKGVADWLQGYGDAHISFKLLFQRPRPYQMSYLLGAADADYVYRFAASAITPSLISGHAFSGLLVRCGAVLENLLKLERSLHALRRVKQYMVDIGDRRVFAGVHYPSDNLASWYCALRLCDHFFGAAGQQAKTLMWAAISEQSAVYQAIKAEMARAPGGPYSAGWKALQAEALRPADPNASI